MRSRIEETGGHESVGEILREVPGVVTRRGSETAGSAGEQIQGIDSRQVLVLIDGQPIVGARGIKRGGVLNLDRQSTARLDRVEVVQGAASALYGSEALWGVINLDLLILLVKRWRERSVWFLSRSQMVIWPSWTVGVTIFILNVFAGWF